MNLRQFTAFICKVITPSQEDLVVLRYLLFLLQILLHLKIKIRTLTLKDKLHIYFYITVWWQVVFSVKLLSLKESKGNTFTHWQEVYLSPPARFKNNNGQNNILYLYYCSTVVILYVVRLDGMNWGPRLTCLPAGQLFHMSSLHFFLPQFVVRS